MGSLLNLTLLERAIREQTVFLLVLCAVLYTNTVARFIQEHNLTLPPTITPLGDASPLLSVLTAGALSYFLYRSVVQVSFVVRQLCVPIPGFGGSSWKGLVGNDDFVSLRTLGVYLRTQEDKPAERAYNEVNQRAREYDLSRGLAATLLVLIVVQIGFVDGGFIRELALQIPYSWAFLILVCLLLFRIAFQNNMAFGYVSLPGQGQRIRQQVDEMRKKSETRLPQRSRFEEHYEGY